ncbi:UDP-glucose 4-epimerase family protein [Amphritea balenae]|uniref:SDR family oxidoreductase n=1 Tax=Amphritea balenae TaxID=452629 RepID=A0A3P1SSM3_9GAMM|nr:SDR family oxidoreductase [Amphritea balenae]RRC99182.1 SDR family oxidoreductase [Amphritea balenae]GGK73271.1 UDP-glucose 4-epimerase [Amphritea balenae]
MRIFLTGSSGFVGGVILDRLVAQSVESYALHRTDVICIPDGVTKLLGDLTDLSDIKNASVGSDVYSDQSTVDPAFVLDMALANSDVVIHAAARAHIMKDEVAEPLAEYRRLNVEGTINLAQQAAIAGVQRFIFISSIKVNGEQTPLDQPFMADDAPAPHGAYGISKWEAEEGLKQLATETGMEVVIIRPPLVYGAGVKGNLASMIKLVTKGVPLPLGAVHNQRSLVAVDNLVDLIITCIDHPAAANQVFLVSDGHDLSTTNLLRGVASAMGKSSRLLPVPSFILMLAGTLLGKKEVTQRLLGSLQVDITKTRNLLDWEPPISVSEGLKRCFTKR